MEWLSPDTGEICGPALAPVLAEFPGPGRMFQVAGPCVLELFPRHRFLYFGTGLFYSPVPGRLTAALMT